MTALDPGPLAVGNPAHAPAGSVGVVCDCQVGPAVYGTFGELAQGYRRGPGGTTEHFLFTLPVRELASRIGPDDSARPQRSGLQPKARAALSVLSQLLGVTEPAVLPALTSTIPVGKGHASSTADIVCTTAWGIEQWAPHLNGQERKLLIAKVARWIESGDYLMHDGIAACNQRTHVLLAAYRTRLRWRIVGIDEGGEIDTAAFHRCTEPNPAKLERYQQLYQRLDLALRRGQSRRVGALATESALLHQDVLPKRHLHQMVDLGRRTGAYGVCVAHSGTLVGLIFGSGVVAEDQIRAARSEITARLHLDPVVYTLVESASGARDQPA